MAQAHPGHGPALLGMLLGCLGVGAILAAWYLPTLRKRLGLESLARGAAILLVLALCSLGFRPGLGLTILVLLLAGVGWLLMMTTLNIAVQSELPSWVRARGLALHLLVFSGGMATGALLWGGITAVAGLPVALLAAGCALLLHPLLGLWLPYRELSSDARFPASTWPDPVVLREFPLDRGPVLVTVEYDIDPGRVLEFSVAMERLRPIRLRDGAYRWSCQEDVAHPGRMLEAFELDSWTEHLRQHERVTREDAEVEALVDAFHLGEEPPRVRHWTGVQRPNRR